MTLTFSVIMQLAVGILVANDCFTWNERQIYQGRDLLEIRLPPSTNTEIRLLLPRIRFQE